MTRLRRKQHQSLLTIQSPERRQAEIVARLEQKAELGRKAESILLFAEETLADAQEYALASLISAKEEELSKVQADYRAAKAFYQKVTTAIAEGKIALDKLQKMEE